MQNCKRKINLALLALIAAGLLAVPPEKSQAQEPENFAWITDTNGLTWKERIHDNGEFYFHKSDKQKVASIFVPEHAIISYIDVRGCVNLTNLVIQPARSGPQNRPLQIWAENTALRKITAQRTMMNSIVLGIPTSLIPAWVLTIQWTELELPKIEMRMRTTANG